MDFASDVVRKGLLGKPYFADLSFVRRYGIAHMGHVPYEKRKRRWSRSAI